MSDRVTINDDPSVHRAPTGWRCAVCGAEVWSWLEHAAPEERTDKAVQVQCGTPRCTEARQPLLGLTLYGATVEGLLARIGAVAPPKALST